MQNPKIQETPVDEAGNILPMIAKSVATFRRDLPDLLKTHYRQWVAYNGEKRIGFAKKQLTLIDLCQRLGLEEEEFAVCFILPELNEDVTPLSYAEHGE